MRFVKASVLVGAIFLTGCASSINAFYQRPVVEDGIGEVMTTVSLSADRRTVLVNMENGKFCAEPPPDVAQNIKTSLEAAMKAKASAAALPSGAESPSVDVDAGLKDKFESEVVILSERTALLDIYRTGTYALCQYHLNGAMKDTELTNRYQELTKMIIERMAPPRTPPSPPSN